MHHKKKKNTLISKNSGARNAVKNSVTSLFMFEKVVTKKTQAKATQMLADRLISHAKKEQVFNAIRLLNKFLYTEEASRKVMEVLLNRYKERPSGFTTIRKVGFRKGDGAMRYEVRLVE